MTRRYLNSLHSVEVNIDDIKVNRPRALKTWSFSKHEKVHFKMGVVLATRNKRAVHNICIHVPIEFNETILYNSLIFFISYFRNFECPMLSTENKKNEVYIGLLILRFSKECDSILRWTCFAVY